jgi:hypothetical protein
MNFNAVVWSLLMLLSLYFFYSLQSGYHKFILYLDERSIHTESLAIRIVTRIMYVMVFTAMMAIIIGLYFLYLHITSVHYVA